MSHEAFLRVKLTEPDGNGDCKAIYECGARGQRNMILHKNSPGLIRKPWSSLDATPVASAPASPEAGGGSAVAEAVKEDSFAPPPVSASLDETDLETMSRSELIQFAQVHELKFTKTWTTSKARTELLDQIQARRDEEKPA